MQDHLATRSRLNDEKMAFWVSHNYEQHTCHHIKQFLEDNSAISDNPDDISR